MKFANIQKFRFESYPAEHNLLRAVFLQKKVKSRAQWFGRQISAAFQSISKKARKNI